MNKTGTMDKLLIPKQRAYKTYCRLQELRAFYKDLQSKARHYGDKEDARDYGYAAAKIGEAMKIVRDELRLTFET